MFGAFDISTSAMTAQRTRLDTISANIANVDSVAGPDGKAAPYKKLFTVFKPKQTESGGTGVEVESIQEDTTTPFQERYEPWNPVANAKGTVLYPNVNLSEEYVNALETTRAYEANVTTVETTKSLMNSTLRLLA